MSNNDHPSKRFTKEEILQKAEKALGRKFSRSQQKTQSVSVPCNVLYTIDLEDGRQYAHVEHGEVVGNAPCTPDVVEGPALLIFTPAVDGMGRWHAVARVRPLKGKD